MSSCWWLYLYSNITKIRGIWYSKYN